MKVTVEPEVVGGTSHGGEDLFLVFKAVGEPSAEFEIVPQSGNTFWDECTITEFDESTEEERTVEGLRCCSGLYDFEWKGTLENLRQLALSEGVDNPDKWVWCGPVSEEPKRCFHAKYLVDGNAD